ncbi:RHS repeat-associated core domain-containing protein [Dyella sp. M7H15-1]|uniref:RHS repeat-associated core domain-containing protein n=1 Tax=Dyella sp. M7H15-1 TaxID=2501295 RepID=UPI001004E2B3|nr:RHS repeat-associated core domain-containing protein [Dyella sp. M7H15-1]QAU23079.1 RHS repeat-associated core domain-containing protein [Dyella sp. M7H15-1]
MVLTDLSGAIREQYSYDPYGNVTPSDTTTGFTNPYQYTGREADSPGLYYYRARYYSPMMAGFISEDSITFGGGQPSFYAYVDGDPVTYGDPAGLAEWQWNGKGNTSVCSYYESMYKTTKFPYYNAALKICMGGSPAVNAMMNVGLMNAWMNKTTDLSEADMYDVISKGLIDMDRLYRKKDKLGCHDCVKGHEIDEYHDYVFMEVGLGSSFYGGNWWPHDTWPNPVPDN